MARRHPPELRQRALRLLDEALPEHATESAAIRRVATGLGIGAETLRSWRRSAAIDSGARPGTTAAARAELRRLTTEVNRLTTENAELRRANEILKAASAFLGARLHRSTAR